MKKIKVTKKDIGRKVIYDNGFEKEEGVITSYNNRFVFVRYGNKSCSEATYYRDLQYTFV